MLIKNNFKEVTFECFFKAGEGGRVFKVHGERVPGGGGSEKALSPYVRC